MNVLDRDVRIFAANKRPWCFIPSVRHGWKEGLRYMQRKMHQTFVHTAYTGSGKRVVVRVVLKFYPLSLSSYVEFLVLKRNS